MYFWSVVVTKYMGDLKEKKQQADRPTVDMVKIY